MRHCEGRASEMYLQYCVKGIAGQAGGREGISKVQAEEVITKHKGILSHWWRTKNGISPDEVADQLTETNLDRHLHDYERFGKASPFISLACGAVERDKAVGRNWVYSAIDTALMFATDSWSRPGALFFLWVMTGHRPAVPIRAVAEPVRDLHIYRRWSAFQLEGEVTAKIHIPANQIERVEWWDGAMNTGAPIDQVRNPNYVEPDQLSNVRELF